MDLKSANFLVGEQQVPRWSVRDVQQWLVGADTFSLNNFFLLSFPTATFSSSSIVLYFVLQNTCAYDVVWWMTSSCSFANVRPTQQRLAAVFSDCQLSPQSSDFRLLFSVFPTGASFCSASISPPRRCARYPYHPPLPSPLHIVRPPSAIAATTASETLPTSTALRQMEQTHVNSDR
jgi:hypothetical protein